MQGFHTLAQPHNSKAITHTCFRQKTTKTNSFKLYQNTRTKPTKWIEYTFSKTEISSSCQVKIECVLIEFFKRTFQDSSKNLLHTSLFFFWLNRFSFRKCRNCFYITAVIRHEPSRLH